MIQAILSVIPTKKEGYQKYQVTVEGKVVYTSQPTHRKYVCIIGKGDYATYRFGRLDLIGKGDSRHLFKAPQFVQNEYWIAKLESNGQGS